MKVFISYSRSDESAVRSLAADLDRARVQVWLDEDLGGGDAWWTEILAQIRGCDVFVFALSDNSLDSKPCRAEVDYATALGLPILPVQIGTVSSYRTDPLFSKQLIDYRDPTKERVIDLVSALHQKAAQRGALPEPLPDPPAIPFEYLQRLGAAIRGPVDLNRSTQASMVSELRTALEDERDEGVRADIRTLLVVLRNRSEVAYSTVRSITEILGDSFDHGGGDHRVGFTDPLPRAEAPPAEPVADDAASGSADAQNGTVAPPPAQPWFRRLSRRTWIAVIAAIVVVVAAAATLIAVNSGKHSSVASSTTTTTTPPVTVAALDGLLLNAAQINAAMGATEMVQTQTYNTTVDDSQSFPDKDCLPVWQPREQASYAASGWMALRGSDFSEKGDNYTHLALQGVVLFPNAQDASAFFNASVPRWFACANKPETHILGEGKAPTHWTFGPVTNTNGTLSVTEFQEGAGGWACERALNVTNNVAIDIQTCGYNVADSAVNVAHQIAANVAKL